MKAREHEQCQLDACAANVTLQTDLQRSWQFVTFGQRFPSYSTPFSYISLSLFLH